jgi:hypothetical protein
MLRLKPLYTIFATIALLGGSQSALAEEPTIQLDMGGLKIFQQYGAFVKFQLKNEKIVQIADRAGSYWPPINTDSRGVFYLGDKVIDSTSGRLIRDEENPDVITLGEHYSIIANNQQKSISIIRNGKKCEVTLQSLGKQATNESAIDLLKDTSLRFVDSDGPLVVLLTDFGEGPADTKYRIATITPDSCRITSTVDVGNPDYLVELGWSPSGHWWITGSTENTLLRSSDGKAWSTIQLPSTISELVSAYISDSKDIWLAAVDSRLSLNAGPLLINSTDGGMTWTPVAWNSPLLKEVPKYWLEGQMRAHGKEISHNQ